MASILKAKREREEESRVLPQQQMQEEETLVEIEVEDGSEPLSIRDLALPSPETSLCHGPPQAPPAPPRAVPPSPPLLSLDFRRDAFELTAEALTPKAVADEFSSGVSAELCGSSSLSPSGLLCGALTENGEGHVKLSPFALGGPQGFAVEVMLRSDFKENSVIFDFKQDDASDRIMMRSTASKSIFVEVDCGSEVDFMQTADAKFTTTSWNHVVVTVGGSEMRIYKDGHLVESKRDLIHPRRCVRDSHLVGAFLDFPDSDDEFQHGAQEDGFFDGHIAYFRVCDTSLSTGDVEVLSNGRDLPAPFCDRSHFFPPPMHDNSSSSPSPRTIHDKRYYNGLKKAELEALCSSLPPGQFLVPASSLTKGEIVAFLCAQRGVLDAGGTYADLLVRDLHAVCAARGIGEGGKSLKKKELVKLLNAFEKPE